MGKPRIHSKHDLRVLVSNTCITSRFTSSGPDIPRVDTARAISSMCCQAATFLSSKSSNRRLPSDEARLLLSSSGALCSSRSSRPPSQRNDDGLHLEPLSVIGHSVTTIDVCDTNVTVEKIGPSGPLSNISNKLRVVASATGGVGGVSCAQRDRGQRISSDRRRKELVVMSSDSSTCY